MRWKIVWIVLYANESFLQTYHNATAEWCSAYKTEMTNDGLSQLVLDMEQAPKTNESHTFTKPVHIDGSLTLPAGSAVSEARDVGIETCWRFIWESFE